MVVLSQYTCDLFLWSSTITLDPRTSIAAAQRVPTFCAKCVSITWDDSLSSSRLVAMIDSIRFLESLTHLEYTLDHSL